MFTVASKGRIYWHRAKSSRCVVENYSYVRCMIEFVYFRSGLPLFCCRPKLLLDPADVKSYRPISNLSFISKLLERIVSKQLVKYLQDNDLLPSLQSAYRANHSTETAVLKILADILQALDSGNFALVTLLDLSAAFDSVDHDTLLRRLQTSYGLGGEVSDWFCSYLSGRLQHV